MTAYSLFDRPSFDEKLRSISNPLHLSCLLAAMSAFSARFVAESHGSDWTDPLHEHPSKIPCPDHFHQLALRCEEEALTDCGDDAPPLDFLQAVILSTWFQLIKGVRGRSWRWLGITIRMAYELNLHLIDAGKSEDWAPSTPAEVQEWCADEERRRAWWAIWEMDAFASTIKRLPTAIKASQNHTHLPIEDRFWIGRQFHASCPLKMEPMDRWKSLQRSGNESPVAWLILVASLMQDAQVSSPGGAVHHLTAKIGRMEPGASQESLSSTEETARALTVTTHALQCTLMTLPDALCYRDEYLSFSSPNQAETVDRRKVDSAKYSIHLTAQLAKFMIHSHSLFGQSSPEPGDTDHETRSSGRRNSSSDPPHNSNATGGTKKVIDRHALRHYTDSANNVLGIINRSSPNHIRYVNPFMASTVWLAAAVQIVEANIGTPSKDKVIQDSKVEILRLTYEKHVRFWDTPRTLLHGLDALDAHLKSTISSRHVNGTSAQGDKGQGNGSHVIKDLPPMTPQERGPNLTGTGHSIIFRRSVTPSAQNTASSASHASTKLVPTVEEDVLLGPSVEDNYFPDFEQARELDLDNLGFDFDLGFGMAADLECSLMAQWRIPD
ncbi:hypothetical protein A1O3_03244 [Capronia epimyces CBS 606.96]|uniref:Xylanolytic transcriptional activator regulatory domain-containing protein n=1 Tax=Capronia epimyces CBS 606.96 TaxID=1182542 RepID=W9YKF5_9EURO|nr:uncharacterized protein A1O3_03244 [Capronia epimyces CBS 606.96]EXJ90175.1 hypothetical protein A1O3_03244 [Capronia epimyces CBS 606.96]